MENKKIKWMSFQSLIGGMMIGAEKAFGCPPVCTIDYEGAANGNSKEYVNYMNNIRKVNMPQLVLKGGITDMFEEFLTDEDAKLFNELKEDVDVVTAVPICSGLSMLNSCNQKDASAKRGSGAVQNNNLLGITRFTLKHIQPKAYIFENAPGMFTNAGTELREVLNEMAQHYGYCVSYVYTDSLFHHNVQARRRTFVFFWKADCCPEVPVMASKEYKNIMDYLKNIPADAKYNSNEYVLNDITTIQKDWFKFAHTMLGDDFRKTMIERNKRNLASALTDDENMRDKYYKWCLENFEDKRTQRYLNHIIEKVEDGKGYWNTSPAFTSFEYIPTVYTKTIGTLLHPTEDRLYNMRELMHFMGLPNDFEFTSDGDRKETIHKINFIAQNVPVMTSYDMHDVIRQFVEGKLPEQLGVTVDMVNNYQAAKKALAA